MTDGQLPLIINPRKLAEQDAVLKGQLAADKFVRFSDEKVGKLTPVDVELSFTVDEQGFRTIKGKFSTTVERICQRCLKPVVEPLQANALLAVVKTEEHVEKLPEYYEPYFQTEQKMPLADLVEDELLLALPIVAVHDTCEHIQFSQSEEVVEKENPFAVLKALKGDLK